MMSEKFTRFEHVFFGDLDLRVMNDTAKNAQWRKRHKKTYALRKFKQFFNSFNVFFI